ncbi:hypothetical protein B5P40_20610 [Bacillus sp. SRB_8]|nr:hypothetical protein B5P40_20610 [Bacillus sp. SRB_8]
MCFSIYIFRLKNNEMKGMVCLVPVVQRPFLFLRYVINTPINNNKGVVTKIPSKPKLSSTNQGKNGILEANINRLSTRKIIIRVIISYY